MKFSAAMKINKINMATKTLLLALEKTRFMKSLNIVKGVNRSHISKKDILCGVQSKYDKSTNNDLENTAQETKN